VLWEVSQKFDLSQTILFMNRGTFDLWDIVTFTLTLLICFYVDINK